MKAQLVLAFAVIIYLLIVLIFIRFLGVTRDNQNRRPPPVQKPPSDGASNAP